MSDKLSDALSGLLKVERKHREVKDDPEQIREVVPIEDWLSPYYIGSHADKLYPFWQEHMREFRKSKCSELLIDGSLGAGKSTFGYIVFLRRIYELSCYKYPQRLFKVPDSSRLFFGYIAVTSAQTKLSGFSDLMAIIDDAPYFRNDYKRNMDITSAAQFPNGVNLVHGSDSVSVLGTNLLGCFCDEVNFWKEGGGGKAGDLEKARRIYRDTTDRRRNRFMKHGVDPGISILVSSSTNDSSFTDDRREKAKPGTCYFVNVKIWDVKPNDYSKEMFCVFAGDEDRVQAVIEDTKNLNDILVSYGYDTMAEDTKSLADNVDNLEGSLKHKFLFIPVDFKNDFLDDPVRSLQNIGGVSVTSVSKLFTDIKAFNNCIDPIREHPFIAQEIVVSTSDYKEIEGYFIPEKICNCPDNAANSKAKIYSPKYFPGAKRVIHVDLSATGDPTGIAMGCVSNFKQVRGGDFSLPVIHIDFMLRIQPPKAPARIDYEKIKSFIMALKEKFNFEINSVSFDQNQSESMLQFFEKAIGDSKRISMDRSDTVWMDACELMYSTRISFYLYSIFRTEWFNLIHDRTRGDVDHPIKNGDGSDGTKDVSDAVVGVITNLLQREMLERSSVDNLMGISKLGDTSDAWVSPSIGINPFQSKDKARAKASSLFF